MNSSPATSRISELDGLRALAVLAVISYHYTLGTALANPASRMGWVGVDLFFVLSGYLITSILLADRGHPAYFRRFYTRRVLRIFPVYFGVLAIYVLAARLFGGPQPWSYWGMHALFLSSTLEFFHYWPFAAPAFVYAGVTVLWSLSVEEQFYLLWAPVVRFLRAPALRIFLLLVVVGAPLLRYALHTGAHLEYRFFPARFDSLAWGGLLAVLLASGRFAQPGLLRMMRTGGLVAVLALGALLVTTGGLRSSLWFATLGYSALAVAFAALIGLTVAASGGRAWLCRGLRLRPLRYLGKISYATYLIHYPILLVVDHQLTPWLGRGPGAMLLRDAGALIITFALAGASWKWYESRILAKKDVWAPPAATRCEPNRAGLRTQDVEAVLIAR